MAVGESGTTGVGVVAKVTLPTAVWADAVVLASVANLRGRAMPGTVAEAVAGVDVAALAVPEVGVGQVMLVVHLAAPALVLLRRRRQPGLVGCHLRQGSLLLLRPLLFRLLQALLLLLHLLLLLLHAAQLVPVLPFLANVDGEGLSADPASVAGTVAGVLQAVVPQHEAGPARVGGASHLAVPAAQLALVRHLRRPRVRGILQPRSRAGSVGVGGAEFSGSHRSSLRGQHVTALIHDSLWWADRPHAVISGLLDRTHPLSVAAARAVVAVAAYAQRELQTGWVLVALHHAATTPAADRPVLGGTVLRHGRLYGTADPPRAVAVACGLVAVFTVFKAAAIRPPVDEAGGAGLPTFLLGAVGLLHRLHGHRPHAAPNRDGNFPAIVLSICANLGLGLSGRRKLPRLDRWGRVLGPSWPLLVCPQDWDEQPAPVTWLMARGAVAGGEECLLERVDDSAGSGGIPAPGHRVHGGGHPVGIEGASQGSGHGRAARDGLLVGALVRTVAAAVAGQLLAALAECEAHVAGVDEALRATRITVIVRFSA